MGFLEGLALLRDGCSSSDRLVTLYNMFAIVDNNISCHCEPRLVGAWQSHSPPSPPRLLRRYSPRNDEGKRLLSVIKMCH
jgi:hypothetical protein